MAGVPVTDMTKMFLDCKADTWSGKDTTRSCNPSEFENLPHDCPADKDHTAFFTGPPAQKLCGYERDAYRPLVAAVTDYVIKLNKERGITHFLTGGGQGFDQLAFWGVERAKRKCPDRSLKNFVVAPYGGITDEWAEEGVFSKAEYKLMVKHADAFQFNTIYRPRDNESAAKLLKERDDILLGMCSICIGLWPAGNDKWVSNRTRGSTAEVLRKALMRGKEIHLFRYVIAHGMVLPCDVEVNR